MQWDKVARNWPRFGHVARRAWGSLTEADILAVGNPGRRQTLVARLQERYGWSAETADAHIDVWLAALDQRA